MLLTGGIQRVPWEGTDYSQRAQKPMMSRESRGLPRRQTLTGLREGNKRLVAGLWRT
jgi:hypothetical protein